MEAEFENKYKDAQKHIKLLETRLNDLNLQLSASNSEKDKLHITINKHKEKIDSLLLTSKKMEKDYATLLERFTNLQKTTEQMPAALPPPPPLSELTPPSPSLLSSSKNDEISSLQDTIRSLESELSIFKTKQKEYAEKERELNRKLAKTAYYQEELTKAQTQITMLETKIHIRTQEKLAFEQEILELRDRIPSAPPENGKPSPKRRVSHRSAVLVTQGNEVVESFESVVEELYTRLGEAEEENRDLSLSLENVQDELMKKYQQILELQTLNTSLQDELKSCQSQNDILENKINEYKQLEIDLSKELHSSQDKFSSQHHQCQDLSKTISHLKSDNEKLLQRIQSLEATNGVNGNGQSHTFHDTSSSQKLPYPEELPSTNDDPVQDLQATQSLLPSYTSARMSVLAAIATNDIHKLKEELFLQLSRYENMKASNAKLLYKLLSSRGNLQVCCRIRPQNDQELANGAKVCLEVSDDTEIACFDRRTLSWRAFQFDKVWDEYCTQTDVFSDIEPLALSVVDGYNACIFAYGQTGSGKTFTMNGYADDYGISYRTLEKIFELLTLKKMQHDNKDASRGIHPRDVPAPAHAPTVNGQLHRASTMSQITFCDDNERNSNMKRANSLPHQGNPEELSEGENFEYFVEVSMLEIYNETVKDLLVSPSSSSSSLPVTPLEIRNDSEGNLSVPGLLKENVSTLEEVLEVFARGSMNRATSATQINEVSSRSHSILMVYVTTISNKGTPTTGKLSLVDLAGSERLDKSGATGQSLKETQHINKSLSALGDVMEGLQKKSKHIPYRNSKLTYFLQDFLGGNSKTMMIVTVCPTELTADETIFALQFAARARSIQMGPSKKNHSWKALEEALKSAKIELRDEKKRVQHLTNSISELKRDMKKSQEKVLNQADQKIKTIDESRKGSELQIEVLTRTNGELLSRLQMEKEFVRQAASEVEALHATIKVNQEQFKQATRENEKLHQVLEVRDKENANLQSIIQAFRERTSSDANIISDRSISTITRASPVKTPKLSKTIHTKPFSSPGVSVKNDKKRGAAGGAGGRHSTGGILTPLDSPVNERPRPHIDLDSLCKPTISFSQHHSPQKDPTAEPEQATSPSPPPEGSYRKGTIQAMSTLRSRDAMMKHQERMKKKREMAAQPPPGSKPGDEWK